MDGYNKVIFLTFMNVFNKLKIRLSDIKIQYMGKMRTLSMVLASRASGCLFGHPAP